MEHLNSTQQTIFFLLVVATLLPLASAVFNIFLGKKLLGDNAAVMATAAMGLGFVCSFVGAIQWMSAEVGTIVVNIPWIPLPGSEPDYLYLGVMIDSLTIAMITMVTFISTLVHLYSIGYMKGDPRYTRFFAYLSLFTFSMLGIVVANSLMELFVFWELVGLTSYLLIGFWFEKKGPQLASKKAFVMNRVGDMGFLTGFGILFSKVGGAVLLPAAIDPISQKANLFAGVIEALGPEFSITNPPLWLTVAGIGLFFGAIGKSAQFPLHTWLPDAMEGPTPVSSIVHSATMVAAGVYLTARIYPILTPGAHLFVATIGLITLVMAACMALVMTDIKKVLAYSTLSQLGYMILGLGTGAYAFALFHLITHAFFKCCLFQCSGSVIHAAHHEQDMRQYGGLWRKMPVTAACYLICTFAIAGASIPFTTIGMSGFYSKDGIIAGTINYGEMMAVALDAMGMAWAGNLFFLGPIIVAYLTVFYMGRSFALTFLGKPRNEHLYDHAHEAPWQMTVPQVVLASMAIFAAVLPFLTLIVASEQAMVTAAGDVIPWVQQERQLGAADGHAMHLTHLWLLYGIGWILSLGLSIAMYTPGMTISSKVAKVPGINVLYTWTINKFYFDSLYDVVFVNVTKMFAFLCSVIDKYLVDGLVNLTGRVTSIFALLSGLFDKWVVDGAVNGAAAIAQTAGQTLRTTQVGRVRAYVLLLFSSAALVMLTVITVVIWMS